MTARALVVGGLLGVALAAGTWRDGVPATPDVRLNGYQVLAVDFHVHTHPLSSSTLAPWDVVSEATRARLDAIAVVPHDHVWAAKLARWFARRRGGPIVLVGEEVSATRCDVVAVGIEQAIPWGLSAASTIDRIHEQGGVAIAAHPLPADWSGCDSPAAEKFDGSEIVHPIVFGDDEYAVALREFNARAAMAAIGDTDHHIGQFGMARTYVFARDRSPAAILEAVREKRTVVYDRDRVYGDPSLARLAADDGRLPRMAADAAPRRLITLDGALAIIALLAAVCIDLRDCR